MNEPGFPISRLRRLRRTTSLRSLFEETRLDPRDFIAPLFLVEGKSRPQPIESMPGHFRWSIDTVSKEVDVILEAGVNAVLLFGTSSKKDEVGALAADEEGLVPKTIRMLKKNYPSLSSSLTSAFAPIRLKVTADRLIKREMSITTRRCRCSQQRRSRT